MCSSEHLKHLNSYDNRTITQLIVETFITFRQQMVPSINKPPFRKSGG